MNPTERGDLAVLYAEVDAEIADKNPRCDVSGRCCRFSEYGHTLFLSAIEAELLFETPPDHSAGQVGECPYQIAGRCTARDRRPLGCRIYFCDPNYAEPMVELSESSIRRLKGLHDRWERAWDYRPLQRFLADRTTIGSEVSNRGNPLTIITSDVRQLDSSRCGD